MIKYFKYILIVRFCYCLLWVNALIVKRETAVRLCLRRAACSIRPKGILRVLQYILTMNRHINL